MPSDKIVRPRGYGLTAQLKKKQDAKFDFDLAEDCLTWMKFVLDDGDFTEESSSLPDTISAQSDLMMPLKDGTILCKIMNVIKPGSVKKINTGKMAFKQMENINNFLEGCESIGCKKLDLFQTVDLYEGQNLPQVINGILALGRKAQAIGYDGPELGPTEATENKREFSEETLRAGQGIIGLQAGSNKGASQAGQNFGKTRSIMD